MREISARLRPFAVFTAIVFASCGGPATRSAALPISAGSDASSMTRMPKSISPALIAAPPMAKTPLQPASAMTSLRRPSSDITPLGFTQLPGAGVNVAASPDGSIWVLSTQGTGTDQYIYHYVNGTWTNIPGAAVRLAVGPDNTLWVVNSYGGIYTYKNGAWSTIAGGASDISVGGDGSVYVISSVAGGSYGNGIWHYVNGGWTQLPGAGVRIAASWDAGTYSNFNIAPGGFYVINATESIFYWNPASGFTQIPGAALQLAPTTNGGLFLLGIPGGAVGNPIYYNNLATGTSAQQAGAAVAIATNSSSVYVIGAAGGIYQSPISPPSTTWTATNHRGFVAIEYGGNAPQNIGIFAPGQSVPSATITYNGCCIYQLAFDAQGELVMATTDNGIVVYAPGNTGVPTRILPAQNGFALAVSPQGDFAIGNRGGSYVAIYPGGVASAVKYVPGIPFIGGLAYSPSGELAVAAADGSVQTYPHGSYTANRTIPVDTLLQNGANEGFVAYDTLGNLAVSNPNDRTIGVYAPGATSPTYTIANTSADMLAFDPSNDLLVASPPNVLVFGAGTTTRLRTLASGNAVALAVDAQGDVAIAGWRSASMVYDANGQVVTISGLDYAEAIGISP